MKPRFDNLLRMLNYIETKRRRRVHWYWRVWYRFADMPACDRMLFASYALLSLVCWLAIYLGAKQ